MTYLLFLDESGHDHTSMPYEVNGGIAIPVQEPWEFIQRVRQAEIDCFGNELRSFGIEMKGHRLLDRDRFKWAAQSYPLDKRNRQRGGQCLPEKDKDERSS